MSDFDSNDFSADNPRVRPDRQVYKYLRNRVGGLVDMNIDGSITPQIFEYVVPAGYDFYAFRLNLGALANGIDPDGFLGLAELTNGLDIQLRNAADAVILDYLDGEHFTHHHDFGYLAGVDSDIRPNASGPDGFGVRWTMAKNGAPDYLEQGQKFVMIINDNLSTIVEMRAMLQGVLVKRSI